MINHAPSASHLFRKPVRISVTLANVAYRELERRSGEQGRSLSNLAAYLLEVSLVKAKD
ncbi:MAG: CopG-like 1 or ribbon-helix-helix domain, 5 [Cyanobacteriota bacterium]|jgi:hypothetical protein